MGDALSTIVLFVLVIGGWVLLQAVILPRMGVGT